MTVEQLVLPKKCGRKVMEMAHSIALAGHLGKKKTTDRVLQRFYWPTMQGCSKRSGRSDFGRTTFWLENGGVS